MTEPAYPHADLLRFAQALLEASGLAADRAATVAEVLVEGDLLGHTSGLTYDFMVDNPAAQLYRDHRVMNDATRTLEECVDLIASLPPRRMQALPDLRQRAAMSIVTFGLLSKIAAITPSGTRRRLT